MAPRTEGCTPPWQDSGLSSFPLSVAETLMDTRTATAELGWTANPASGVSVSAAAVQPCSRAWRGWRPLAGRGWPSVLYPLKGSALTPPGLLPGIGHSLTQPVNWPLPDGDRIVALEQVGVSRFMGHRDAAGAQQWLRLCAPGTVLRYIWPLGGPAGSGTSSGTCIGAGRAWMSGES